MAITSPVKVAAESSVKAVVDAPVLEKTTSETTGKIQ